MGVLLAVTIQPSRAIILHNHCFTFLCTEDTNQYQVTVQYHFFKEGEQEVTCAYIVPMLSATTNYDQVQSFQRELQLFDK